MHEADWSCDSAHYSERSEAISGNQVQLEIGLNTSDISTKVYGITVRPAGMKSLVVTKTVGTTAIKLNGMTVPLTSLNGQIHGTTCTCTSIR